MYRVETLVIERKISISSFDRWISLWHARCRYSESNILFSHRCSECWKGHLTLRIYHANNLNVFTHKDRMPVIARSLRVVTGLRWAHRSSSVNTPYPINKSCLRHDPFINTMADNHYTRALLKSNAQWAAGVSQEDPNFFPDSANNPQTPHVRPFFFAAFHNLHFLFRLFG